MPGGRTARSLLRCDDSRGEQKSAMLDKCVSHAAQPAKKASQSLTCAGTKNQVYSESDSTTFSTNQGRAEQCSAGLPQRYKNKKK